MYDVVAGYYDVLHRELTEDVPLLVLLAHGGRGHVLELGCGTGRVVAALVEAGFTVVGLDNSAEMLAIARRKIRSPNATFIEADMMTLALDQRFDLIIVSHNTLMHLNERQLDIMLARAARHLVPGGKLFIDTENPFAMATMEDETSFEAEEPFVDPASGLAVTPFARWQHDAKRQVATVEWRYERADGVVYSAEIDYHYHYPHMLQMLLAKHGLRWQIAYGDYDRSEFEEESARLIVLATS